MQLFYIVDEIMKKYPQGMKNYMEKKLSNDDEEYFQRPNNPRELLILEHFLPFLMQFLQEMKNEAIEILIDHKTYDFLKEREVPIDDISQLKDEDLLVFKQEMQKNKVSQFHASAGEQMDTIFNILIDIMSRRVLLDNPTIKLDQVVPKLKLVAVPEDIVLKPFSEVVKTGEGEEEKEETVHRERNTNEEGMVLLTVPLVEVEEEIDLDDIGEIEPDDVNSQGRTKIVKKLVESDQQGKAIAIKGRDVSGQHMWTANAYAAKVHREEFLDFINR